MICLGKTFSSLWERVELQVFLHRHIIYQNDPVVDPDFLGMVPDLYGRRQGHQRLPYHHHEPRGPSYITILYNKMITLSGQTLAFGPLPPGRRF